MIDLQFLITQFDDETRSSISSASTLVIRHTHPSLKLRRALPFLAAEQPETFNAYQQIHSPRVEKQLSKAKHLVSLIGDQAGRGLYVGIYEIQGSRQTTYAERLQIPAFKQLTTYAHMHEEDCLWFNLQRTEMLSHWSGKLAV